MSNEDTTLSDYDNFFQESIYVKPNSKIGLLSLSMVLNDENINVDSTNNTFTFQTKGSADARTVTLTAGSYNKETLLTELERALSACLTTGDTTALSDIGYAIDTRISASQDIIDIHVKKGTQVTTPMNTNINCNKSAADKFSKTSGAADTWNAFGVSDLPNTNGCGVASATLTYSAAGVGKKAFYGLLKSGYDTANVTLDPTSSDVFVAILATGNQNYTIIDNGVVKEAQTLVASATDDVLSVETKDGKVYLYVDTLPNPTLLYSKTMDYTNAYDICISFKDTAFSLGNLEYYPSPFEYNPDPAPQASQMTLDFGNETTASFYGFKLTRISKVGIDVKFEGQESLDDLHIPSSIIVELPELPLQSYDGKANKRRRRNIIAVIPSLEEQNGYNMIYRNDNPIMVDLHNEQEGLLNRIRVRVMDFDDKLLKVRERVAMTFLLSEKV